MRLNAHKHMDYLRAFRAPCLQTLELENVGPMPRADDYNREDIHPPPPDESIQYIMDFIDRSQCQYTLTHLRLKRFELPRLSPLLAKLTALTHLVLSAAAQWDAGSGNWLFDTLYHMECPLPVLESLTLLHLPAASQFHLDCLKYRREARRNARMMDFAVTIKYDDLMGANLWGEHIEEREVPHPYYV